MQQKINKATKFLSNFIEKPINIILSFITFAVFITNIVKYFYLSSYVIKCQEFYKIPAKYFGQINTVKVVSDLLPIITLLVVIIILTLISIITGTESETGEKSETEKESYNTPKIIFYLTNFILGIVMIFIIYGNLMNITLEMIKRRINIEYISSHISIFPFLFLFIAILIGCGVIFSTLFKKRFPKLALVQGISIVIAVLVIFFSIYYSMPIAPHEKSQYEVTFISNETENSIGETVDNRVILSEIDGNFLTVSYKLDDKSDAVIFYTQSYKIIPMEDLELSIKQFNQEIKIDENRILEIY